MNRAIFYDAIRAKPFGGSLSSSQVDGIEHVLDEWERRRLTDLRWLAYMLAIDYHETAHTMQPIREKGGEAYLRSKPYYPWVGEGLVQVTWETNARKFGATKPGDLLSWPVALRALFDGMIDGMFTGKKLADYFTASKTDWTNARRIVNGTDRAALIAGYAKAFYAALQAAQTASTSQPVTRQPDDPGTPPAPPAAPRNGLLANILILLALAAAAAAVWWRKTH